MTHHDTHRADTSQWGVNTGLEPQQWCIDCGGYRTITNTWPNSNRDRLRAAGGAFNVTAPGQADAFATAADVFSRTARALRVALPSARGADRHAGAFLHMTEAASIDPASTRSGEIIQTSMSEGRIDQTSQPVSASQVIDGRLIDRLDSDQTDDDGEPFQGDYLILDTFDALRREAGVQAGADWDITITVQRRG